MSPTAMAETDHSQASRERKATPTEIAIIESPSAISMIGR